VHELAVDERNAQTRAEWSQQMRATRIRASRSLAVRVRDLAICASVLNTSRLCATSSEASV
jgi:hypothetical protein